MQDSIQKAIDDLYQAFSGYKIEDMTTIGCFDFGPTEEEVKALSNGLRNIPDETIQFMEFYGSGWDSWGSKIDIGFLLPRLMQYVAEDIERLDDISFFSLFNYKLLNFFSDSNSDWSPKEKESLNRFIKILIREAIPSNNNIGLLIECAFILDFDLKNAIKDQSKHKQAYKRQLISLLDYFDYIVYGESYPKGYHFDDSAKIKAFLDSMIEQLAPDEVNDIIANQLI